MRKKHKNELFLTYMFLNNNTLQANTISLSLQIEQFVQDGTF